MIDAVETLKKCYEGVNVREQSGLVRMAARLNPARLKEVLSNIKPYLADDFSPPLRAQLFLTAADNREFGPDAMQVMASLVKGLELGEQKLLLDALVMIGKGSIPALLLNAKDFLRDAPPDREERRAVLDAMAELMKVNHQVLANLDALSQASSDPKLCRELLSVVAFNASEAFWSPEFKSFQERERLKSSIFQSMHPQNAFQVHQLLEKMAPDLQLRVLKTAISQIKPNYSDAMILETFRRLSEGARAP